MSDVERENPVLVHGKLGAFLARTRYHIDNGEILSAICHHTVGRPNMGLLEKIVYVADFMEPGRVMDCQPHSLTDIRKMSFHDIDRALLMVLECTVTHLRNMKAPMDPLTLETYHFYCKQV